MLSFSSGASMASLKLRVLSPSAKMTPDASVK
jgi:hypothetical protein